MKRAVILHGTDGSPSANWFPWLKQQLEQRDYAVLVPDLPQNHTPNRQTYNDFLLEQDWDFADNLIVGHSSGAVSILNLLMDDRFPTIKCGVLVGAWAHMEETDLDWEQFKDLFPPNGFDFAAIKKKCEKLLLVHAENDPYCPVKQAHWLAEQTNSELVLVPGGQHFSFALNPKYKEFPKLVEILDERHLL